jgi:hypothetical protein
MAWKWYEIHRYRASVGGSVYYGGVQMLGDDFYGSLRFLKEGPLPDATAPTTRGQRFYGFMDYQQMREMVDILRNEKPVYFGWHVENPNNYHLMSGNEPVGEGDGLLADD